MVELPHWARVAFAARCARQVFRLLTEHWPGVPWKHANAVRAAIVQAEEAAATGCAVEDPEVAGRCATAAGAALRLRGNPPPKNAHAGTIASFVAKTAEKAAEAAQSAPEDSLAAREAWDFAYQAATSVDEDTIVEQLQVDFMKLHDLATQGQWTHQTKVSTVIWEL
jgi:hypothetical protein